MMLETHRKHRELSNQLANGIHIHNLNSKIARLENRIAILESKWNELKK